MFFTRIVHALWGDLKPGEFKKFSLLALGSFFLIGAWWPLKTLKDTIFINTVGPIHITVAKILSVALFFPLVLLYSRLVAYFTKQKLIYFFIGAYTIVGLLLVYLLTVPSIGLANPEMHAGRILGWAFYVYCESYISLLLALYQSFINDVITPESAKRGYGLIAFGTQLGGFLFTLLGNCLTYDTTQYTSRVPLIVLISLAMFVMVAVIVYILQCVLGKENLKGYEEQPGLHHTRVPGESVGFFDGLKLLLTRPYVAGIFALVFFQEFISTMMFFQLSLLTKVTYQDPALVTKFFFHIALAIQAIACLFGLFGTSYFYRRFGIQFSLVAYPLLIGVFIVCYLLQPTLYSVVYVVLIAKALGYALNQPAKEMLYIPTSKNIKYKSKAWIDMFGMRFAKATGSGITRLIGPAVMLTGGFALILIGVWASLAHRLGKVFKKTIDNNEIIE